MNVCKWNDERACLPQGPGEVRVVWRVMLLRAFKATASQFKGDRTSSGDVIRLLCLAVVGGDYKNDMKGCSGLKKRSCENSFNTFAFSISYCPLRLVNIGKLRFLATIFSLSSACCLVFTCCLDFRSVDKLRFSTSAAFEESYYPLLI